VKTIVIEREIGGKGGKFALAKVLTDFNNFQEKCQVAGSSQVLVKKIVIEREIGGKRGEVCPSLRGRGQ